MELSRIDRAYVDIDVTATLSDGSPAPLTGVDVALLPPRSGPTATTTWAAATYASPTATVLVAGPDADPTGAIVVPDGGADLWLRSVDNPEVTARRITRISVA